MKDRGGGFFQNKRRQRQQNEEDNLRLDNNEDDSDEDDDGIGNSNRATIFEEFPLMSRSGGGGGDQQNSNNIGGGNGAGTNIDSDDELNDRNHLIGRGRRRTIWTSICCCFCIFTAMCFRRFQDVFCRVCCGRGALQSRYIRVGLSPTTKFPSNVVKNQKYNLFTFIPVVLFNQFKFFLNFYFLVMACSQFLPEIRVGYLSTYWGPLGFVLFITMCREAFDDICRYRRDKEINSEKYEQLTPAGSRTIKSANIKVGDLILVKKDQRVPADMILLRTTEKSGTCFIRTDQLDGETDWKLRIGLPVTQHLLDDASIFGLDLTIYAEKPQKSIHTFLGTAKEIQDGGTIHEDALNVENTLWCSTVVASGTSLGLVIYTGRETRATMNASQARSKVGLLDCEVNNLTKILFFIVILLAFVMVCLKGFAGPWYRHLFRFILLFSYIIPLSLRVTLDLAKFVYAYFVSHDKNIPDTVVRSSTIPEELGRISFLLSDKTGTLTQNQMIFKKLHLGNVSYTSDTFDEIRNALSATPTAADAETGELMTAKYPLIGKIQQAVEALALCHNVTPVNNSEDEDELGLETSAMRDGDSNITYQASSPDEVALVAWTGSVGMQLIQRDLHRMRLRGALGDVRKFVVLQLFPFTSESKRMGIIVQDETTKEITFYLKGADSVMTNIVQFNDWLEEECSNLAREGLRTLVVAKKPLTEAQYQEFEKQYHQAKISLSERASKMAAVVSRLERDMQLLCVTGVEDSLQKDVRVTLEMLRNAGIKVWMLTGDKLETAICIAKSSGLFTRNQNIHVFNQVTNRSDAHAQLNALRRKTDSAMVITGDSLKVCLQDYEEEFAELASGCPAVVCCRCSPEQKAQIVNMLKKYHRPLRVAAIGDGGNDVSMIQAADAGIGIVGKEGMQASLAADFSITQFSHLLRLLLVHGRNCYKRSCALAQFVIHRGLIISTMQAVFSCVFYFVSVSLYPGTLMVLYSTIYTSFPVFSLVMDRDIKDSVALTYPELYKELFKGRSLSYKTFFVWVLASIYQGAAIMYLALVLFDNDFIHIVSITFTALILTELIMVALTVHRWHWAMIVAEIFSVVCYAGSLFVLNGLFDVEFVKTWSFWWKTAVITIVSCLPLYIIKCLRRRIAPPSYTKLN